MFCEKCGTHVDDGQPFCPNCGNRMGETPAEAAPAAAAQTAARPAKAAPSADGLLGKLNAMQGLEKTFYPIVGGLFVLSFLLSLLKVFSIGYGSVQFAYGSPFFATVMTVLFTLCITFYVLDYFNQFTFKWLWFFLAGAAAVILLIFVIVWIDCSTSLSAGGWLLLISLVALAALSILLLIEKRKK